MSTQNVYSPDYDANGNPKPSIPELKDAIENQFQQGSRADLPTDLKEGQRYLVTTENGTDLNVPVLAVGAAANSSIILSPSTGIGELYLGNNNDAYIIDWIGGVWRGTTTLTRTSAGTYEGSLQAANPSPASDKTGIYTAIEFNPQGLEKALTFRIEMQVKSDDSVVVKTRNEDNSIADHNEILRQLVAVPFDLVGSNTQKQQSIG